MDKRSLSHLLFKIGNKAPELSDAQHVARLRDVAKDSNSYIYLDGIHRRLTKGESLARAVSMSMGVYLHRDDAVWKGLHASTSSEQTRMLLLTFAFTLLDGMSFRDHLRDSILGSRYCMFHKEHNSEVHTGPPDIDVFTRMTGSHPDSSETGESINVSISFHEDGSLNVIRAYPMGGAPSAPVSTGDHSPQFTRARRGVNSRPNWLWRVLMRIFSRVKYRSMHTNLRLIEFAQGWAVTTVHLPNLDIQDGHIEIRGRTRGFSQVEVIEIGDGKTFVTSHDLDTIDRECFDRLTNDMSVRWQFLPAVLDAGEDYHDHNCILKIRLPQSEDELAAAQEAFVRERGIVTRSRR